MALLCVHSVVNISHPPEDITVCRGSDVVVRCGYSGSTALPVTWIINGSSFNQQDIVDSPLYQLNNPTSPMMVSLTVFSINGSTTFQCMVQSTTSTMGTVTVATGMYVCVCIFVCVYVCMYMYVCMHVCMYVCMYVHVHV